MKKYIYLSIIIFTLSSCEKETFVEYYIDNQSSLKINIKGSDIIHSTSIEREIEHGEKKEVSNWTKRGKEINYFEPVSMFGHDLIITNFSGDTLIKDYKVLSNWSSDVTERKASANHKYTLVISDMDF